MPTLDDVARAAGVSRMTVSRYINNSGYVSKEAAEKVEKAAARLGYRRNLIAKSLVTRRTNTIGLVIASISNPFYSELVLGVDDESYSSGYNVILCNADGKKREEECIKILIEKCVDGIIFCNLNINALQLEELNSANVACVLVDNGIVGLNAGNIYTDNANGGYIATDYLISLGHENIACIHGRLLKEQTEENRDSLFHIWNSRMRGFEEAMKKRGLTINPRFLAEGDGTAERGVEGGWKAMNYLLSLKKRPTAVYAHNDFMAVGAMNAIFAAGLKVPDDVSVIGHDGIALGEWVYPKLTTINQPRYQMGRMAARKLIAISENREKALENVMNSVLIVRDSTKRRK